VDDQLFAPADQWRGDAIVQADLISRRVVMAGGYKKAADHLVADHLVKEAMRNRAMRDFLVYPAIFCYRHYIELSLKNLLHDYGTMFGVPSNWQSHNLTVPWQEFEKLLVHCGMAYPHDPAS
jgi:hypothetical protein